MMTRTGLLGLLIGGLVLLTQQVRAEGRTVPITTRDGVKVNVFWEPTENATATVLLFPGGGGGYGQVENGRPQSGNFLVRSMPHFLAEHLNVAIFGRPSDHPDLDQPERLSERHRADVSAVLAQIKTWSDRPVWLVGTSNGTVSVAALAIGLPREAIAGAVLTSSIVGYRWQGALPRQNLAAISVPTLMLHHARDACAACRPEEVGAVFDRLSQAPVKKLIMAEGGANPKGDVCGARHWHGYIGMEREAVALIAGWMRAPTP